MTQFTFSKTALPLVSLACLINFSALAQDENLTLEVSGGVEYDSNITVEELDTKTNKADFAALLDFSAGYSTKVDDVATVNFGYDFSQSIYKEVSEFNLQSHGLSLGAETEVNDVELGLNYNFFHNRLGGDSFLNMHMISPNVAYFFGEGTYVRGNYTFMDKSFETAIDRNAKTHSVGVDVYQFAQNGNYFSVGLRYEMEGASADEFDYKGFVLNAAYQAKFDVNGMEAKTKVGLEFVKRNYDNITPSIAEIRDDKRTTFKLEGSYPFYKKAMLKSAYNYIMASSNFDSADFNEHVISLSVGYSF